MNYRRSFRQFLAPLQLFFFLFSGGYTTGPEPLVSLLRQRSRPYLFSNSLPPPVVGCASKALDLLMESNAIVQSMAAKTRRYGPCRGGSERGRDGSHTPFCLLLPTSVFSFLSPLPQHPPSVSSALSPSSHFPTSLCPSCPCLSPSCSLGLYFCLFSFPLQVGIDPEPLPQAPWPLATCDTQLCPQVPQ